MKNQHIPFVVDRARNRNLDMVFINIQVPLKVIKTVLLRGAWYKWTKYYPIIAEFQCLM